MHKKNTLLLVFIHGFKGNDHTFHHFPDHLRALIAHSLPQIDVLALQYPQFQTRGDLHDCVANFKEWLQNKVIDLEVANQTPSPTVDPGVHVILCGHSMGGIVAAEALLSIAGDEVVPVRGSDGSRKGTSSTTTTTPPPPPPPLRKEEEEEEEAVSTSVLFFPRVKAVLAFDTPYLGISPGVLAHGAEEQIGHANKAYQAYDQAAGFFGWGNNNNKSAATPQPIANASSKGLPAPGNAGGGGFKWGKLAMYAGAAAGIAGVAGAAYMGWNHINQGVAWASSHLEFVSCLARGAELQKRVEKVVALTSTHDVGFANFYGALDPEKVMNKTKYAGQLLGEDRTFCVIPKQAKEKMNIPTTTNRPSSPPSSDDNRGPKKDQKARQDSTDSAHEQHMSAENEQVRAFADDRSKSKGRWVKCVNSIAGDEITAHQSMFVPDKNPDYHAMLPRARDQVLEWIDWKWYEQSEKKGEGEGEEEEEPHHDDIKNHGDGDGDDDDDDDDDNDNDGNDDHDEKMEDPVDGGDVATSSPRP